jgi:hypothetical protein
MTAILGEAAVILGQLTRAWRRRVLSKVMVVVMIVKRTNGQALPWGKQYVFWLVDGEGFFSLSLSSCRDCDTHLVLLKVP